MPCNHAFSSDYEGFGAFFYSKKVKMEIPSFTVKNRLKSLQIEYYSTALLSKLDTHNLRRSLLNYRNPLKLIFSNPS